MFWPVGRYRELPRGGDHSGSDRPCALCGDSDAPDANTGLNAPEPVEARTAEQDKMDQQSQDEQECEQAYKCSARIEDLPNFVHLCTPVTIRWVLLYQQTPGGPSIVAPLLGRSQGRARPAEPSHPTCAGPESGAACGLLAFVSQPSRPTCLQRLRLGRGRCVCRGLDRRRFLGRRDQGRTCKCGVVLEHLSAVKWLISTLMAGRAAHTVGVA